MKDLEAIRARDASCPEKDFHVYYAMEDRRALLKYVDELREAARKVTDARCEAAAGCGCKHCRAVGDLRRLLGEKP